MGEKVPVGRVQCDPQAAILPQNTHKPFIEPSTCNYRCFKVPSDRSCFWSDRIGGALPTRDPDLAFPR